MISTQVGTWLTPMPGGRVGGADRWRLPDPADRDVQVCPGVLPRSVAVYPHAIDAGLLERRRHGLRDAP